eukprot:1492421-Rhodomonas_salina.1
MSEPRTERKQPVVVVSTSSARNEGPGRRYQPKHPFVAGAITGGIEILITYPLEYTKCQMQLHQEHVAAAGGAGRGGGGRGAGAGAAGAGAGGTGGTGGRGGTGTGTGTGTGGQNPPRTLGMGDSRNRNVQNQAGNDRRGFRTSPVRFNVRAPQNMPNRLLSSVPVAYPTSILGVMKETVQHRGVAGL